MVKQKSLKGTKDHPDDPVYTMDKFFGEGIMFKCKLFGSLKVAGPRGDEICADAIAQLKKLEHAHVVHKISYISHDKDDRRTFGYIVSLPEGYHLFAFKAEKNAGIITSNLKELFHVVYLKHKQGCEKQVGVETSGEGEDTQCQNEFKGDAETVEDKDENPYAVPMKFQLFEQQHDDNGISYTVPSGVPAFDSENSPTEEHEPINNDANLLDWTNVNEELEILQKDLKRSDTRQLLAELGDFDMETNPPRQPDGQTIFSDDPFFKPSTSSASEFFDEMTTASRPATEQVTKSDPFFPVSNEVSVNTVDFTSTVGNSNNFGAFDNNDAFAPTQQGGKQSNAQGFFSDVGDLFSGSSALSQGPAQFGNDWSASFTSTRVEHQAPALRPTVNENSLFSVIDQTPSPELQPEKVSEPSNRKDDPFAALTGDISDIRGTLPTASGTNVPQFPKKKPAPPLESTRVISPGPSLQPSASMQSAQGQFANPGFGQQQYPNMAPGGFPQNNPFSQSNMQHNTVGYSAIVNAPPIPSRPDMPPIPTRQDLLQGNGLQSMQGSIPQQQQQQIPPIPKPYSQSRRKVQGGVSSQNSASPTPPQSNADPFAGLGTFSINQAATSSEPLYAVVDKSQKTSRKTDQGSSDLFGIFDGSGSVNVGGVASISTGNPDQDPFGFGL